MAKSKREQNMVREVLLKQGVIRASAAPSEFRSTNKKVSTANAIAARQLELRQTRRTV